MLQEASPELAADELVRQRAATIVAGATRRSFSYCYN